MSLVICSKKRALASGADEWKAPSGLRAVRNSDHLHSENVKSAL